MDRLDPKTITGSFSEVIAYSAGILDGEGSVGLGRNHLKDGPIVYCMSVRVKMTDSIVPQMLCMFFGGNVTTIHSKNLRWSDSYNWYLSARIDTLRFLRLVQPLVLIKKPVVNLGIQYLELFEARQKDDTLKEAFYLKFKELNRRGPV